VPLPPWRRAGDGDAPAEAVISEGVRLARDARISERASPKSAAANLVELAGRERPYEEKTERDKNEPPETGVSPKCLRLQTPNLPIEQAIREEEVRDAHSDHDGAKDKFDRPRHFDTPAWVVTD
jgi:hypothetical protein